MAERSDGHWIPCTLRQVVEIGHRDKTVRSKTDNVARFDVFELAAHRLNLVTSG